MLQRILDGLSPAHPWRERVRYYDTISSTNDVLKEMAAQGAPHGTVLIAGQQTGGRGRLGRTFLSPADVGIYMSVLLRPNCAPDQLMHLTCAAALATCKAMEDAAGIHPGIKWTNDIVCSGRKLSGILTELGFGASQTVDYAVIGIGINCCQSVEDFPEEIRSFAGSLEMVSGKAVDRAVVAAAMINAFEKMDRKLLSDRESILRDYRANCITLGQYVSVVRGDSVRHGTALDVDAEGGLIVAFDDGVTQTVSSGEVSVRGLYHYV